MPSALLDVTGGRVSANRQMRLALGEPAGGEGRDLSPGNRTRLLALAALAGCDPQHSETCSVHLDTARGSRIFTAILRPQSWSRPEARQILAQLVDAPDGDGRPEEARESDGWWAKALAGLEIGGWDVDLDTGIFSCSDTWKLMRGMAPSDPTPQTIDFVLSRIHPEDRDRIRQLIALRNSGAMPRSQYEYRYLHSDGAWIWLETRWVCVAWRPDGRPWRIIGTDFNITDRKNHEKNLALMSRRLRVAMEASRIGVFEADIDVRSVDWDEGMFRVYGLPARCEVKIGGIWESLLHPDDRDPVIRRLNDHIDRLIPFSDEFRIIALDGSVRYIRSRTIPFIDSDGHKRMIGANWDVTDDIVLRRDLERARNLAEARNRDLEAAKAEIERIALLDPLTKLPNRRDLDHRIAALSAEPAASPELAILHIDLDRFKQINDTFGHGIGDKVLQHVARILTANTRDSDFVARIGGDEFVLIVRHADTETLADLAHRIITLVRRPIVIDGNDCRLGASIGIAVASGLQRDVSQLLLNADIALYQAKNKGRSRYEFFTRESRRRMEANQRIADELYQGLERDEFLPHYQLQFDARTLDIVGVESLVRWRHPVRGVISPAEFLAVAGEIGIMGDIDRLILEKTLADCRRWDADGFVVPRVSVNVSMRRLHDADLSKTLAHLPISPGRIGFELLESIFLDEIDSQVMQNLEDVRRLGIRIEIDDFGSGHASIVSLLKLRPAMLKIDRQLVQSMSDSTAHPSLVGSIVHMGHSLGISVLAEGVETPSHVRTLQALGCDFLQGFGLARPLPSERVVAFAQAEAWRGIVTEGPDDPS